MSVEETFLACLPSPLLLPTPQPPNFLGFPLESPALGKEMGVRSGLCSQPKRGGPIEPVWTSDSPKALNNLCLQPVTGLQTQTKELVFPSRVTLKHSWRTIQSESW